MAVEGYVSYAFYAAAAAASMIFYVISQSVIFRYLVKILAKEALTVFRLALILFSVSFFLALTSPVLGAHDIFILVFALFLLSFLSVLLGARHLLEEFFTGVFASRAYDLKVGEYVEIEGVRGYIVALDEASIVVKDPRRGLVYVPYTKIVRSPFSRIPLEEGHRMRVEISVPRSADLEGLGREILSRAAELGVEEPEIHIDSVEPSAVKISFQGIVKDPRREDEVRREILLKALSALGSS